jgi:hypothetical protein
MQNLIVACLGYLKDRIFALLIHIERGCMSREADTGQQGAAGPQPVLLMLKDKPLHRTAFKS